MPQVKKVLETASVTDSENQPTTPKRARNVDEILSKSLKKTPSKKLQTDDFTPRRSVRTLTRATNLSKPLNGTDAKLTLTPRNAWIESEIIPSSSNRRAKSVFTEQSDGIKSTPSVPKSTRKRNKSLIATLRTDKELTVDIEISNTTPKIAKPCSPPDVERSVTSSGEIIPTLEGNDIVKPQSIKSRGKSLIFTPKKAIATPKIAEPRSDSSSNKIVTSSNSSLQAANLEEKTNDSSDKGNNLADTIQDIKESEQGDVKAHEGIAFKETKEQRCSDVDLTEMTFIDLDSPFKVDAPEGAQVKSTSVIETLHAIDITPLKNVSAISNSSLILDSPDLSKKPCSNLNDTFTPEPRTSNTAKEDLTARSTILVQPIQKTSFSVRTPIILKTPIASVKRLKSTSSSLLKREQTPGCSNRGTNHSFFAVSSTPKHQLLEAALPLTILKSIRKRSFSVDGDIPKKEKHRVTFHSPANQQIPINELDLIMENSRREEKRDLENKPCFMVYRRKRSLSNAETAKDRAQPLKELNAAVDRGTSNTKIKIPDFAAIHKRRFERMESIDEYKNRKEDRSKEMLSNKKLHVEVKGVSAIVDSTARPVTRKNLFDALSAPKTMVSAKPNPTKIVKPIMAGNNKLQNRQVKNKEAYKAGSSKHNVSKNVEEAKKLEKKKIIRGVRTNRRFELQMEHRNNLDLEQCKQKKTECQQRF